MARKEQAVRTGFASVGEVAKYLQVSRHAIYRAVKAGRLACTQINGSSIRILWEDVHALHGRKQKASKAS